MNSNQIPNNSYALFKPVTSEIIQRIEEDPMCLESVFWTDKQKTHELTIVLTNFCLAICQKGFFSSNYLSYVELSFDLKFQVIYQDNLAASLPSSVSHHSKKIGFRLFTLHGLTIDILLKSETFVDPWVKFLGKFLNQYGFHQLFKPIKKLGKGGFATVYEVQRTTDGKKFAVKAFSKQATLNSENVSQKMNLLNELKLLRKFDNSNVIHMEGVFESENSLYIVLELLDAGQLHSRINKKSGSFTLSEIKRFITGMAKGLKHIHSMRIMHRDIKPENIMLRDENSLDPIIVDFGLAAEVQSDDYIYYRCGTPGYVAPEVTTLTKQQKIEPECDIFSVGVILHILLLRKPLFEGKKFEEVYDNNRNMRFDLDSPIYNSVDGEAMDLMRKMLKINPSQRITASEILSHPFIYGSEQQGMNSQKYILSPKGTESSVTAKKIFKFGN